MLLKLSPMASGRPGQALLRIIGWKGATTQLELTIVSNQGNVYLQPPETSATQWSSNPFWFRLDALTPDGEDFYIPVGAAVVDPLLSTTNARYQVSLREIGSSAGQQANLKVETGIRLSEAGGETESRHAFGPLPSDPGLAPPTPVVADAPVAEAAIESDVEPGDPEPPLRPAENKKSRSALPLIIAAVVLVMLLGAAAYWWLNRAPSTSTPAVPEKTAAAKPGACDDATMASQGELEFVQACMKQNPDTDTVLATIAAAMKAGHCGIAQRLYANRGRAGDTRIALAYAREYDPQTHHANACFKEPDAATAAYWYDTVLSSEPENAQARQRFEELSK